MSCAFSWWWWACPPPSSPSTSGTCTRGLSQCLRYAFFQVSSIISTTGFATADFCLWPQFSQIIFDPADVRAAPAPAPPAAASSAPASCWLLPGHPPGDPPASSTPAPWRWSSWTASRWTRTRCASVLPFYRLLYAMITLGAALVVALDDFSFASTLTAVITCISNVGPGLERGGPGGQLLRFLPLEQAGPLPVHDHRPPGDLPNFGHVQPQHLAPGLGRSLRFFVHSCGLFFT